MRLWYEAGGDQSSAPDLLVQVCTRSEQTAWTEDQFIVTSSAGIRNREKRVADIVVRELKRAKPGFGTVPGRMTSVERKFEFQGLQCKWEEYKGTRYSDGDSALVVELWLHRVVDDLSGLTFQEWDPSVGTDDTSAPVTILVNSSELRTTDFPLEEVRSLQLDTVSRGGRRTRGASVRTIQGVGNRTFVLSVQNDNDFRSRCE